MANENGSSYAPKLDESLKQAVGQWFDKLSKAELLQFLHDREDLTADMIRDMLRHEQVVLGFGLQYFVNDNKAQADFGDNS